MQRVINANQTADNGAQCICYALSVIALQERQSLPIMTDIQAATLQRVVTVPRVCAATRFMLASQAGVLPDLDPLVRPAAATKRRTSALLSTLSAIQNFAPVIDPMGNPGSVAPPSSKRLCVHMS